MSTERPVDVRLRKMAARLKLSYTRDHLHELLESVITAKFTPREALEYVFSQEIEQREANRIKQALMAAHFPYERSLSGFDMTAQPSLDPGVIRELSRLEWIEAGENVAIFGPPGVGKTHLAIAFGRLAIEKGYPVRFYSAAALIALLEKAHKEGNLEAKLREINKPKLLIIDELGYLPFGPQAAHLLFHLVCRRYEKKSILITGNRPPSEWGLIFGDTAAAAAVLDRLLHHCTVMTILGDSYRIRHCRKQEVMSRTATVTEPEEQPTVGIA